MPHADAPLGNQIKTVVILVAMEAEAAPIAKRLGLHSEVHHKFAPPAPCLNYSGTACGLEIHVVCNGKCATYGVDNVGTVPAALTAFLALQAFKPDLVISAGTAGGFRSRGGAIADVYLGTSTRNHDRRIPIPGFDVYGVDAIDLLPTPRLAAELKLKTGVVTTGNSLDFTAEDMAAMTASSAAVKEMEAASVAWAARMFNTRMIALKAVTDIVDGEHPPQEEFLQNLGRATAALQDVMEPLLHFIANKTPAEL